MLRCGNGLPATSAFHCGNGLPAMSAFHCGRGGVNLCTGASAGSSADALKRRPQVAGLERGPLLRR